MVDVGIVLVPDYLSRHFTRASVAFDPMHPARMVSASAERLCSGCHGDV